jgi:hypothetical protein
MCLAYQGNATPLGETVHVSMSQTCLRSFTAAGIVHRTIAVVHRSSGVVHRTVRDATQVAGLLDVVS